MLDVRDLVDLAGGLAVPARTLVRIGDRFPGDLGETAAHGAQERLLGSDVSEAGADPLGTGLEVWDKVYWFALLIP